MIPDIALKIRDSIVDKLITNLSSVLLYGSSRIDDIFWDIDILIIFKENKFDFFELDLLKEIAKEFKNTTLDLQFLYEKEIRSPDFFSLDSHGAFFTRILKRATPLFGDNPFLDFEPNRKQLLVSLVTRIQRYLFHARQEYILGSRYNKDRNPKYHQKHVIRSMFDLLMINNEWLDNNKIKEIIQDKYPDIFSNEDWKVLEYGDDNIKEYILLYEKVYNLALDEISNKNRKLNFIWSTAAKIPLLDKSVDNVLVTWGSFPLTKTIKEMQRVVRKGGVIIRIGAFKMDDFTILFPKYSQKRINLINNSFRNFGFIIEPHIVNIKFNSVIEAKQILSRITGSKPEEINKTKFEHIVSLCYYFKK